LLEAFMSVLVELPPRRYPADVFGAFRPTSDFELNNARAMMWMSQLAYETAHPDKVRDILKLWGLDLEELISNEIDVFPWLRTACGIVAAGRGATILALAGTDPLKLNDWITNIRSLPSPDDIHTGFQAAVAKIWPKVASAVAGIDQAQSALFVTGHSLGAALAVVAAERALRELGRGAAAVYTFGCPRPGGSAFGAAYLPLSNKTYRLVHGIDWVPTVPSHAGFRHVGRMLRCDSEKRFVAPAELSSADNDEPRVSENIALGLLGGMRVSAARRFFSFKSTWLENGLELLPQPFRDHIPTKYLQAVGN
jgi:hypothetical protein